MKQYTGTKTIMAVAMTLGAYNEYREWDMPDNEDPEREGYLVEYEPIDGEEPNHPKHEGYISWSPKQAFEDAYRESDTYVQRIQNELDDLTKKLDALNMFQRGGLHASLSKTDQRDLRIQKKAMVEYSVVLGTRLKAAQK